MNACWKCDGHLATLTLDRLRLTVDLEHPHAGIQNGILGKATLSQCRLLHWNSAGPTSAARLIDHYQRGDDLVATYASADSNCTWQFYWRAFTLSGSPSGAAPAAADIVGIDFIPSVQTDLLEFDSSFQVCSDLGSGDMPLSPLPAAAALLFRPPGLAESILHCALPADHCELTAETARGTAQVRCQFFAPHLEKGVIRRGRLRLAFVRRATDEREAQFCYDALRRAPLPLTT